MGNQLDNDLPEEVLQLKKSKDRQFLTDNCLQILPEKWKRPPGKLMSFYACLPPGLRSSKETPDNLCWWPDVTFLAHTERTLVTSAGALLDRPGYAPTSAYPSVYGLLYRMTYSETLECSILTRSGTSALPNVCAHPSGHHITWAGKSNINVMNLTNYSMVSQNNSLGCIFYCTSVTRDGNYMAVMSRCSDYIKLETFLIGCSSFLKQFSIDCHWISPHFKTDLRNQARFQCKFSADGKYIACGSSRGQLFVVSRYKLQLCCNIVPGLVLESGAVLANERSFDFDPRFSNRYFVFCDTEAVLHLCDLDSKSLLESSDLLVDAEVQCLRYSPTGYVLAIAFSDGTINIYDPDLVEVLYTLDMTALDPDCRIIPNARGKLPDLIQMSFSSTGNLLATSATDGMIRVWQLMPELSLTALCRRAILQFVPMKQIFHLPLPVRLMKVLLQWPDD